MMDLTPIALLIAAFFALIIIFLALGIARFVKSDPEEEQFTKKLEMLRKGDSEDDPTIVQRGWFLFWYNKYLKTGRLTNNPNQPGQIAIGLFALGFAVGAFIWPQGIIGGFILGALGTSVLLIFFNIEANRRSKTLEKQLPLLLSSLRAQTQSGNTPARAIMNVAGDLPSPIGDEFRLVRNDLNVNVPLSTALQNLVSRVESKEIKFLVASIETGIESGQDLDGQLQVIEDIVIQRQRIAQRLATAISEVSTSLWVSGLGIPLAFVFSLYQSEENTAFWGSLIGLLCAGVIGVLYAIGMFISYKQVKNVEKI